MYSCDWIMMFDERPNILVVKFPLIGSKDYAYNVFDEMVTPNSIESQSTNEHYTTALVRSCCQLDNIFWFSEIRTFIFDPGGVIRKTHFELLFLGKPEAHDINAFRLSPDRNIGAGCSSVIYEGDIPFCGSHFSSLFPHFITNSIEQESIKIVTGFSDTIFVMANVWNLYSKCGNVWEAYKMFEKMTKRDMELVIRMQDIFAVIEQAIVIDAMDYPKNFKYKRDRIAELLYSCKVSKCFKCDEVVLAVLDGCEKEDHFKACRYSETKVNSRRDDHGYSEDAKIDLQNHLRNYSNGESEVLTDEIEEQTQMFRTVFGIPEILANYICLERCLGRRYQLTWSLHLLIWSML